jgi:hypothetical protein
MLRTISAILIVICLVLCFITNDLTKQVETLKANETALLNSAESYRVNDSLSAAHINQLQLSLSQFEKYRAEDQALIKALRVDNKGLQDVITSTTETNRRLQLKLKDSLRVDTITQYIDTLKCFSFKDSWTALSGCFHKDTTTFSIQNIDSLISVTNVKRKRFLFFKLPVKWFGYRSKQATILSKNPYTTISHIEYITINH